MGMRARGWAFVLAGLAASVYLLGAIGDVVHQVFDKLDLAADAASEPDFLNVLNMVHTTMESTLGRRMEWSMWAIVLVWAVALIDLVREDRRRRQSQDGQTQ